MKRKRLPGADRRALILEAAKQVFAENGFSGAKTQKIAAAAKVSEALIFQHFPSKTVLYRAVLRKLIQDQDEAIQAHGALQPSTDGLIDMMRGYFGRCLRGDPVPNVEAIRLLYASLAGDGDFARLTYKRSVRLTLAPLAKALEAARACGDLVGEPVDPLNIIAFFEHIGSTMCIARIREKPVVRYAGDDEAFLRQIVFFCGRGIGLTEEAIRSRLDAASPTAEVVALPIPAVTSPRTRRTRET